MGVMKVSGMKSKCLKPFRCCILCTFLHSLSFLVNSYDLTNDNTTNSQFFTVNTYKFVGSWRGTPSYMFTWENGWPSGTQRSHATRMVWYVSQSTSHWNRGCLDVPRGSRERPALIAQSCTLSSLSWMPVDTSRPHTWQNSPSPGWRLPGTIQRACSYGYLSTAPNSPYNTTMYYHTQYKCSLSIVPSIASFHRLRCSKSPVGIILVPTNDSTFWLVSWGQLFWNIWNHDPMVDVRDYYSSCQSNACSKKSNLCHWEEYLPQCLKLEHLISQLFFK